ncbi:MAG: hypothetical protein O3A55_01910 [Bacteroidetes bacterium]|nr:hypothetical protein [Bacteroidota bacterium]
MNTQEPLRTETEMRSASPSAPTKVNVTTPAFNMDLLLDLYNKDIDFIIEYSGSNIKESKGGTEGQGDVSLKEATNSYEKAKNEFDKAGPDVLPAQYQKLFEQLREAEARLSSLIRQKQFSDIISGRPPATPGQYTLPSKTRDEDLSLEIEDVIDTSLVRKKLGTYSKDDADYNRAISLFHEGQRLFSRRRYLDAMDKVNNAIQITPNLAMAFALKGSIYYMLKQDSDAKKNWEKALELDPGMDDVRAHLYKLK